MLKQTSSDWQTISKARFDSSFEDGERINLYFKLTITQTIRLITMIRGMRRIEQEL